MKVATQKADPMKLLQACAIVIPLMLTSPVNSTWKRVTAHYDFKEIVAALRSAYGMPNMDAGIENVATAAG